MEELGLIEQNFTYQMEQTGNQIIEKYAESCLHCKQNALLLYQNDWTRISLGYNVKERKSELTKKNEKKNKFCQSIEICCGRDCIHLLECINFI